MEAQRFGLRLRVAVFALVLLWIDSLESHQLEVVSTKCYSYNIGETKQQSTWSANFHGRVYMFSISFNHPLSISNQSLPLAPSKSALRAFFGVTRLNCGGKLFESHPVASGVSYENHPLNYLYSEGSFAPANVYRATLVSDDFSLQAHECVLHFLPEVEQSWSTPASLRAAPSAKPNPSSPAPPPAAAFVGAVPCTSPAPTEAVAAAAPPRNSRSSSSSRGEAWHAGGDAAMAAPAQQWGLPPAQPHTHTHSHTLRLAARSAAQRQRQQQRSRLVAHNRSTAAEATTRVRLLSTLAHAAVTLMNQTAGTEAEAEAEAEAAAPAAGGSSVGDAHVHTEEQKQGAAVGSNGSGSNGSGSNGSGINGSGSNGSGSNGSGSNGSGGNGSGSGSGSSSSGGGGVRGGARTVRRGRRLLSVGDGSAAEGNQGGSHQGSDGDGNGDGDGDGKDEAVVEDAVRVLHRPQPAPDAASAASADATRQRQRQQRTADLVRSVLGRGALGADVPLGTAYSGPALSPAQRKRAGLAAAAAAAAAGGGNASSLMMLATNERLSLAEAAHPLASRLSVEQEQTMSLLQVVSRLQGMAEGRVGVSAGVIFELIIEPCTNAFIALFPKIMFKLSKWPLAVLLDSILKEAVLNPLIGPAMDNMDPNGGGAASFLDVGTPGSVETASKGLQDDITADVSDAVSSLVAAQLTIPLNDLLRSQVQTATTRTTSRMLIKVLSASLTHSTSRILCELLSLSLTRLPTRKLTAVLVPSLTHSLAPIITRSLTHSPSADYYCYYCTHHSVYCDYCRRMQEEEYRRDFYTNYYAEYYSSYYGRMYSRYHADVFTEEYFKKSGRSAAYMPHISHTPPQPSRR